MSNWTQRLSKVQASTVTPAEVEPIGHLTLSELKETPMTFGKAHLGKKYEEIWSTDPNWIRWFLGHYASSTKTDHRKMIKFIQMKIEESETEVPQPSAKSLPKSLGTKPKAKAMMVPSPEINEEQTLESFEMMSDLGWEPPSEQKEEINALQARMLNLENAMQRMLHLMQNAMPLQPAMPADHPDSAVAEWDDPWNN